MHANLGTQPTESVFTANVNGRTLDAGDFALGQFNDFGIEAMLIGPAQVHAQQNIGPVLRFGPTGTGLNIQVAVVGVHLTTEHAAEFELLKRLLQTLQLAHHIIHRALVALFGGHFQQFAGIRQAAAHFIQGFNDLRQCSAFTPQVLGALRVVPDTGIFQLTLYFGQTITLVIVVKDTP